MVADDGGHYLRGRFLRTNLIDPILGDEDLMMFVVEEPHCERLPILIEGTQLAESIVGERSGETCRALALHDERPSNLRDAEDLPTAQLDLGVVGEPSVEGRQQSFPRERSPGREA